MNKLLKLRKKRNKFIVKRFGWNYLLLKVVCIYVGWCISSVIFLNIIRTNNLLILIPIIIFAILYSEIFYYKFVYKLGGGK